MDRRTVWAILLMMVIAIAPALFIKRPPRPAARRRAPAPATAPAASDSPRPRPRPDRPPRHDSVRAAPDRHARPGRGPAPRPRTRSRSPRRSTPTASAPRAAGWSQAELQRYRSMAPEDSGAAGADPARRTAGCSALTLVLGRDTIPLDDLALHRLRRRASPVSGPTPLRLSATREARSSVELTYTFHPDDYRDRGERAASPASAPTAGSCWSGMGPTLANTEANIEREPPGAGPGDPAQRRRADRPRRASSRASPRRVSGPLDWAALKSKYFVTGVLAYDTTGGASAAPPSTARPTDREAADRGRRSGSAFRSRPSGDFSYTVYAGPMEYDRLGRLGHGFDDVNPYGWPGFRTLIRPVAVGGALAAGLDARAPAPGLRSGARSSSGMLVRLLLWPLNQKAMRANMQLQAVQPLMKDIQERHKNDPQKMQQEMFKLYKEYGVNPLGGCWPMLLPMPVLFALFFVFQNTIELRGASLPLAAGPLAGPIRSTSSRW